MMIISGYAVIKVISLDFAGVIAPKDFIDYFWFVAIPKRIAKFEKITLYEAIKYVENAYESVSKSMLEWYLPSYWANRFGINDLIDDAVKESIDVADVYGDAIELIPILGSKYLLIIATNTIEEIVRLYLTKFTSIGKYIKKIYSCINMLKEPNKTERFYKAMIDDLGVNPSDVIHIGDDMIYDGEMPRRIGIRSIIVNRKCKISFCVRDLYEAHRILSVWG